MQLQANLYHVSASIILAGDQVHQYTADIPAQDSRHARNLIAYAIAAAWPGSSHIIHSVTKLTDEEIAQRRQQFPLS